MYSFAIETRAKMYGDITKYFQHALNIICITREWVSEWVSD